MPGKGFETPERRRSNGKELEKTGSGPGLDLPFGSRRPQFLRSNKTRLSLARPCQKVGFGIPPDS